METVRNTVRRHRERRGWSLRQLAQAMERADLEGHLSKIERGLVNPHGTTKERIAAALAVPREVLFPEDQEREAS